MVLPGESSKWRFTGFYGFPEQHHRHRSWDLLRRLSSHNDLPWVVGGDFNEILAHGEESGGLVRATGLMESFREGLLDCDIIDLGFVGRQFTWSNNRVDLTIRCRLDRCCGNSSWMEYAPLAPVDFRVRIMCRLCLECEAVGTEIEVGGGDRRDLMLTGSKRRIVRRLFARVGRQPRPRTASIKKGIKACQLGFRQWARDVNKNPKKHIEQL